MHREGLVLALALASTLGFAQRAAAQCAEGREVTEATAGRCCWPAQHWNAEAGRCEGPPSCPAGRFAEGDTCVAPAASPAGAYGGTHYPTTGYVGTSTPGYGAPPAFASSLGYSPMAGQTRTIASPVEELVITGGLMAISGFVYSVIAGSVLLGNSSNGSSWVMFIPLVGGFIYPAVDGGGWSYWGYVGGDVGEEFGIPGSAVQTLGLLLMIIGGLARETSVVPAGAASLAPELVAGPGEVGLGLRWGF